VLIFKMALRNLKLNKLKSLIVGLIIMAGTILAILGNSFVDTLSFGMKKNLINSVTGEIQIYSSDAKEKLSIFGSMDGGNPDVGHINDFHKVKTILLAGVPNIKTIIPMGTNFAMFNPGNILDIKLEELRALLKNPNEDPGKIQILKDHIQAIVLDVVSGYEINPENMSYLMSNKDFQEAPKNLKIVSEKSFWDKFTSNPQEVIEFLANKLAPLIFDDNMLYFSYIGTVPTLFQDSFPLFEVVKGSNIPEGKRGFLLNDNVYENMVKHRVARRLDTIKKKIEKEKMTIAKTKELQEKIKANISEAAVIYTQITPADTKNLIIDLQQHLNSQKQEIRDLLQEFLAMDDQNFFQRYQFFYAKIAPHLILYKIKIGDVFPVNAFTKTGFSSSLNLKLYGTYHYKSFESSPIAGNFSIMDMMSFRELYGFLTPEKRKETQELEIEMGLSDEQESMDAMFTKSRPLESEAGKSQNLKGLQKHSMGEGNKKRNSWEEVYSREAMENGVFLNAAILLKDPTKIEATIEAINLISKENNLGIQAVDWKDSAGIVGQLTTVVRILLYLSIFIIFTVAMFVMMNAILMATLERAREIGTMRAIGAQKSFILSLLIHETFILSFIFGLIGMSIGVFIVLLIGKIGIPAMGDVSTFFFSGDRLYLTLNPIHLITVFISMTVIALLATQYPAWKALKISPLEAMQKRE